MRSVLVTLSQTLQMRNSPTNTRSSSSAKSANALRGVQEQQFPHEVISGRAPKEVRARKTNVYFWRDDHSRRSRRRSEDVAGRRRSAGSGSAVRPSTFAMRVSKWRYHLR